MVMNPALLQAVKESKNRYGRSDGKTIKPKDGRNIYRILAPMNAPWVDPVTGKFWADLGVHWIKTGLNVKPTAVVGSRDVCFGEPCQVGAAVEMAMKQATELGFDEETKKIIEEMKVSKSVLFNAIDRGTDPKAQNVDILEVRPSVAQQILDLYMQYAEAGQDMFDLALGIDLVVTRSGKGLSTEYTVNVKPGASVPVAADALAKCHDLKEHIQREHFRGEEQKAITVIQQIAGISVPRIAANSGGISAASLAAARTSTPTPALTSAAAAVPEVDLEAALAGLDTPTTPASVAAAPAAADPAAEIERLKAQLAAAQAASAPAAAPAEAPAPAAAAPAPATPAATETGFSEAEVDDVLAQLSNL